MSHALKVFLKIIHSRIYRKCEEHISDTQFGFRSGLGTRDAQFCLNFLVQRCLDIHKNVYLCFIDYEKAFDKVRHEQLVEIIEHTGIDKHDLRIITNLYWAQKAMVKIEDRLTKETDIKRGVRQGCILSPLLFNVYAEKIMSESLHECEEGIVINGEVINNIRYADDTILIAESIEGLQILLDRVNEASNKYGLTINSKKTNFMVLSRTQVTNKTLLLGNTPIERVEKFKYLGSYINEKWSSEQDVRVRIELARSAFIKMKKILCSKKFQLKLRMRLVRCYVFSVLFYGMESWTLTPALCSKLEAFEFWVYRRMLNISWVQKVTNVEVLRRMGKSLEVLRTVKERKLQYFGHVMRGERYRILQLVTQGKIQGKRRPGRRKTSWLKNLREWFNTSTRSLFRAAASRVRIAMMVANLRGEGVP